MDFTLYALRPPAADNDGSCGAVIGSTVGTVNLHDDYAIMSQRPTVVVENVQGISVQKGDYIGLHISIGSRCGGQTEVWLRGKDSPNTVFLRRSTHPNLGCEMESFTQLGNAMGFISASVGEFNTLSGGLC